MVIRCRKTYIQEIQRAFICHERLDYTCIEKLYAASMLVDTQAMFLSRDNACVNKRQVLSQHLMEANYFTSTYVLCNVLGPLKIIRINLKPSIYQ